MENKTLIFYDFEATSVSRDADMISVGLVAVTVKTLTGRENNIERLSVEFFKNSIFNPDKNVKIKTFYAEFTDFNLDKCDDWVKENIVNNLQLPKPNSGEEEYNVITRSKDTPIGTSIYKGYSQTLRDTKENISAELKQWLSQFENPVFIADFDVIDKPMLIDLISYWNVIRDDSLENDVYQHCKNIIIESQNIQKDVVNRFIESYPIKTHYRKFHKIGLPEHLSNINYYDFYDLHTMFFMKEIDPDINREEFVFGDKETISIPTWLEGKTKHNALYDAYINYLCYNKLKK